VAVARRQRRVLARGDGSRAYLPSPASGACEGFERGRLADVQRARIFAAVFDVIDERCAANVTVAHIVERSGVSRRTFYEQFADRNDCLLAAFGDAIERVSGRVRGTKAPSAEWRERVRTGLAVLLSFLDEQPVVGRVLLTESFACGPEVLELRERSIQALTSVVDEGRSHTKQASAVIDPSLTAEGVVGGALAVVQSRLSQPQTGGMQGLLNPLMSMIVLPYLGAKAARRELERPALHVKGENTEELLLADPFKHAGMRLTYRTLRVLSAIAQLTDTHQTGPSNRQVGEQAGIADQGQISKLLSRLERIHLIHNTGLGPGQGAPNEWMLTAQGRQLANTVNTHGS
jgi:AcrR family transcriptional regulator